MGTSSSVILARRHGRAVGDNPKQAGGKRREQDGKDGARGTI